MINKKENKHLKRKKKEKKILILLFIFLWAPRDEKGNVGTLGPCLARS